MSGINCVGLSGCTCYDIPCEPDRCVPDMCTFIPVEEENTCNQLENWPITLRNLYTFAYMSYLEYQRVTSGTLTNVEDRLSTWFVIVIGVVLVPFFLIMFFLLFYLMYNKTVSPAAGITLIIVMLILVVAAVVFAAYYTNSTFDDIQNIIDDTISTNWDDNKFVIACNLTNSVLCPEKVTCLGTGGTGGDREVNRSNNNITTSTNIGKNAPCIPCGKSSALRQINTRLSNRINFKK